MTKWRNKTAYGHSVVILEELPEKIIGAFSNVSGSWSLATWHHDGSGLSVSDRHRLSKLFEVGDLVTVVRNNQDAGDLSFRGKLLQVTGVRDDGCYDVVCLTGFSGNYYLDTRWELSKATSSNISDPAVKAVLRVLESRENKCN